MKHIYLITFLYLMTFAVFPSNKAESKKEVRLSCEVSKTQDGVVKCHDVNGKGK